MSLNDKQQRKRIAILGGGPSALFMYKKLVESEGSISSIDVFEKKKQLGAGMPYSIEGANQEHITNVSGNEIPELITPLADWIQALPEGTLTRFKLDRHKFNEYKVLPRLLFGEYLSHQFKLAQQTAATAGVESTIHIGCLVTDIKDDPENGVVKVQIDGAWKFEFDLVIICTGHKWPVKYEGTIPGYFDSPYPPSKLVQKIDHPVAIKGSSLTAIDAIRTLARQNGSYATTADGTLVYHPGPGSEGFKLVMHSRNGMLPAVRFHLEDSHLSHEHVLSHEQIKKYKAEHDGFLPLDLLFEKNFKAQFITKDPDFYEKIKDMDLETFVAAMMALREKVNPFQLLKGEYAEAAKSIKRRESVHWKEALAVLSFSMNYPAKYLSAEDTLRLQKVLMPLIAIVIAFVPQSSVEEMLALYDAGVLSIVEIGQDGFETPNPAGGVDYTYRDGEDNEQSIHYKTFVDAVGQPHLSFEEFPYRSLLADHTLSPARLRFKDATAGSAALENGVKGVLKDQEGNYTLVVPGVKINDDFQAVDAYNALNERIYIMAVPYISGFNPDYSGLDFCDSASTIIAKSILKA